MISGLASILRRRIALEGPMPLAVFMAEALLHPRFGYYVNHLLDGSDFVTAPEVSQLLGELIGGWLIDSWQQQGSPRPMAVAELGPGRGSLMSDVLRLAQATDGLPGPIFLVESSPLLRRVQEHTLRSYRDRYDLCWIDDCSSLPDRGALFVIANEFFDALPIRQLQRTQHGWHERLVGLDGEHLIWTLGPASRFNDLLVSESMREASVGSVAEIAPARTSLMMTIASHIRRHAGAALVIDYGYTKPPQTTTLQAIRQHTAVDVLEQPGLADLTALVDFTSLITSAEAEGARIYGPITQREWLLKLGVRQRAQQLMDQANQVQRSAVERGLRRLLEPKGMGEHFLVLEVSQEASLPHK